MYAITGITGKVGGAMAEALLAAGKQVRAVVRNPEKASEWTGRGCEIAVADINDEAALAQAFTGCEGVFVLAPPNFDPLPGFPEAHALGRTIRNALAKARPARVVSISTVGAQADQTNLLSQHTVIERALSDLPMPLAILRPAWFLDNLAWDIASARDQGVIHSFLQPLDRKIPMVSTGDIGNTAAGLIQQNWSGRRIVELEGPARLSPREIAAVFADILGRPVRAEAVARESWASLFLSQGMRDPMPRIQMLDGFNEGWIDFEGPQDSVLKGSIDARSAIARLVHA